MLYNEKMEFSKFREGRFFEMTLSLLFSFLGAAILLSLMPGPDNLFVMAQSLPQSWKAGVYTTLGLCTGLIVHITAAVLGISAIIYQSTIVFTIVKWAGAAYLLYLAWQSFRAKDDPFIIKSQKKLAYKDLYKRGILMNVLNPKVSLFFLALLPQFINPTAGQVSLQMLILGVVFLVQAFMLFSLFSIFAGTLRKWLIGKPVIAKRMNKIQGVLFVLIGLKIAFSER